jgi:uncharacterized membrane protein
MTTGRLEAFSDGVFAIAITLLVLNLTAPDRNVARGLARQWPGLAAYVLSFVVVGIIWMNHHALFERVVAVDRPLMLLNLHLLLWVALLPFPTSLVAKNLTHGFDGRVSVAVYSGVMTGMSVAFSLLWGWVVRSDRLLHASIDPVDARARSWRFYVGLVAYPVAVVVSFVNAPAAFALHCVLAVYYLADQLPKQDRTNGPPDAGSHP